MKLTGRRTLDSFLRDMVRGIFLEELSDRMIPAVETFSFQEQNVGYKNLPPHLLQICLREPRQQLLSILASSLSKCKFSLLI